jgi:hypothetical protein
LLSVLCLRQRGLYGDCLGVALIPSNPMGLQSRRNPRVKGADKLPIPRTTCSQLMRFLSTRLQRAYE